MPRARPGRSLRAGGPSWSWRRAARFAPDLPDSEFGFNWTAIGIENIGFSDLEIIKNRKELNASLALTRWLRCTYGIALKNVIGHNESLSSPYHRERVPAFAHQTHSDWNSADMHVYRRRLSQLPCA